MEEALHKAYKIVSNKVNKIKNNNLLFIKNRYKQKKTKKRHFRKNKSIKKMKTRRRQNGGHRTEWHAHSD